MLTDVQARKAKPAEKPYKMSDEKGLFLLVATSGHRSWRMKYRFGEKEKLLTFGPYPEVSLHDARDRRDAARKELRDGIDPATEKKKRKAEQSANVANSFEAVARAWHALNKPRWSATHSKNVIDSLEQDLFASLGALPIRDVTEALLLAALEKVENRGARERAKRIRQRASEVFAYAAAKGLRSGDPAAVIKTLLKPNPPQTKQPAITDLDELRQMIRDVEVQEASPITKLANRWLALTAVRSAVQCGARWDQFSGLDGAEPLWDIPPSAMKLKLNKKGDKTYGHLVPMPTQALEVLAALRPLTGHLDLLFPNERHAHRPMSNNAVRNLIIRAAGGTYHLRHCPHGYRSSFNTIMNEWRRRDGRPDDREVLNLMLAHIQTDKVEGAYNRAQHMERRRELAQVWADLLFADFPPAEALLGPNWKQ
ncbi:MAG: integrase [Sphingomonas bacterium]|nr:integrase [Sphingomonas bacterium]